EDQVEAVVRVRRGGRADQIRAQCVSVLVGPAAVQSEVLGVQRHAGLDLGRDQIEIGLRLDGGGGRIGLGCGAGRHQALPHAVSIDVDVEVGDIQSVGGNS